jgi:hypothetical protein
VQQQGFRESRHGSRGWCVCVWLTVQGRWFARRLGASWQGRKGPGIGPCLCEVSCKVLQAQPHAVRSSMHALGDSVRARQRCSSKARSRLIRQARSSIPTQPRVQPLPMLDIMLPHESLGKTGQLIGQTGPLIGHTYLVKHGQTMVYLEHASSSCTPPSSTSNIC